VGLIAVGKIKVNNVAARSADSGRDGVVPGWDFQVRALPTAKGGNSLTVDDDLEGASHSEPATGLPANHDFGHAASLGNRTRVGCASARECPLTLYDVACTTSHAIATTMTIAAATKNARG